MGTRGGGAKTTGSGFRVNNVSHPLFWEGGEGRETTGRTEVLRHNSHERWYWRGMFESIPLPPEWPVYVSYAEAAAYARWRGNRLMTEAEYQRAAFGVPAGSPDGERPYPWGNASPSPEHGVFDFSSWDPEPVGSHPGGRSAWGVDDLAGNGWEWTSTVFAPFPGFKRDDFVSRVFCGLLRWRAHGDEGRLASHGGRAPAADVQELVSSSVPLCLCDLSLRRRTRPRPLRTSRATSSTTWGSSRASCRLAICTTPLGSALFDAICELPWYRHHSRRSQAARRTRPRYPRARGVVSSFQECQGCRGSSSSARATGRSC